MKTVSTSLRFVAMKIWKAGGETVIEYFETEKAARKWITKQYQPKSDEWKWDVKWWD